MNSAKIDNLITEFRATHLQRLNNRDIRRLWDCQAVTRQIPQTCRSLWNVRWRFCWSWSN